MTNTPVGLLDEERLIAEYPSRRAEILDHAIRERERSKVAFNETSTLITFHPIQTLKIILITGLVTFILAFVVSQVVYVGHAYTQAKAFTFDVPTLSSTLSLGAPQTIAVGSYIPTSTPLALASTVPNFGLKESIEIAILAMALLLIERLVVTAANWKKSRLLKQAANDLDGELDVLREWRSRG
ncbi:MAG: hypothetical protein WA001_05925 [Patescibacteria group bacterium]